MACLRALGCYLPARIVANEEIAAMTGADPAWIAQMTGIAERRFAAPDESVEDLGVRAAQDCLNSAGLDAREVGMVIAASGSAERRFPGPAAPIAERLGAAGVPAIDLPMASAGSVFGLALAARLCPSYGNVLVVGAEIMSRVVRFEPAHRDTAILFGDGAGACLVSPDSGFAEVVDSQLGSDGALAGALRLDLDAPLHMEGRAIILHASRKLPRVIADLLERHGRKPAEIAAYLLHQANRNLIDRVAGALGAEPALFFHNLERYGNTSSASLLIALAEWRGAERQPLSQHVALGAFGAGLNWGAILLGPPPPPKLDHKV
ncbi:MAG TPA: ketoacyl-ACP synthase III [Bryobacteraceae bacterium]|nr:ketoacyl-ACP synthase III [Bryobacteraceae bacterium]